jgi:hypothetical protein
MKTKGFLSLVVISLALSFIFFACSSDSDPSGPNDGDSSSSAEQQNNQVFCQLTAGSCSQMSFSSCMELVTAGMARIVSSCNGVQSSSSLEQSSSSLQEQFSSSSLEQSSSSSQEQFSSSSLEQSSSSTGRLPCGTQTYNPNGQFCVNGGVYELCGGQEYDTAIQFCQNSTIRDGWRTINGEDWWDSPSSDPWIFYNEVGSVTLNSSGGVKFSAVSGSTESYYLQLSQDGHNLKAGDCYRIELWGGTNSDSREIQLGFQQIGGDYTAYWAEDFICEAGIAGCRRPTTLLDRDNLAYGIYAYITGTEANARFYVNAGYNSASVLTVTDLVIEKLASNTSQLLCEGF